MTVMKDAVLLDNVRRTNDGYLACEARAARTGIQEYRGFEVGRDDLDIVRVYRSEAEVFGKDALHSFAHRPVTVDHPGELVSADNWKAYAVGHTGDEILRDGEYLRVPMVLMDSAAIAAVEGGKKQLSMGYTCDLQFGSGVTPSGEAYDAVQTDIRGNHLAIVSAARGGPALKIGDDSTHEGENIMEFIDVMVDGLAVQVTKQSAPILQKFLDAFPPKEEEEKKKEEEAAKEEEAKKKEEAKDAEIATLKSQLDAATLKPEQIDALVNARIATSTQARSLMGDKFVTEGKSDATIRREVVLAKVADSKEWSDVAVEASFNTLVATTKGDTKNPLADAIAAGAGQTSDAREDAYAARLAELSSAWKTK